MVNVTEMIMIKKQESIDIFELAKQAGFDVSKNDKVIDANGEEQGVKERIMIQHELRKFSELLLEEAAKLAQERGHEFRSGQRGGGKLGMQERNAREAGCNSIAQMLRKMKTQL
jgi:hypothetical protein